MVYLMFGLIYLLSACTRDPVVDNWRVANRSDLGVSFSYPPSWLVVENDTHLVRVIHLPDMGSVQITEEPLRFLSLEAYRDEAEFIYQKTRGTYAWPTQYDADYTLVSFAGSPAFRSRLWMSRPSPPCGHGKPYLTSESLHLIHRSHLVSVQTMYPTGPLTGSCDSQSDTTIRQSRETINSIIDSIQLSGTQ